MSAIRVGVTGHVDLTEATARTVAEQIREHLETLPVRDLVGVSCMARGADTLFAQQVVALGARLVAIIPSADYVTAQIGPAHAPAFRELLEQAAEVRRMPALRAGGAAYIAANEEMLASIDRLVAVWDGQPHGGAGSTVTVVRDACARRIPVTVIWPEGARRGGRSMDAA